LIGGGSVSSLHTRQSRLKGAIMGRPGKPLFDMNVYGYRERAQHCRDFAMSLRHDDPLRASMLETANRFDRLALADQQHLP
jgi:hypothetical protein